MTSRLVSLARTWAILLALGCADLTTPPEHRQKDAPPSESEPLPTPPPTGAPTVAAADPSSPIAPAPLPDVAVQSIGASHILVSYQGATRAKPTVTRTKQEALALARQLAAEARKPGVDFSQLARDSSDGPSGVEGGALPKFGRQQMVKPFSDAAFALEPGGISDVVETNFGFHIIKRTE